ncbi:unnamed protein product [Durusdinium trenchii]|uniref:Protein kinase domain-containing protein n=1 Tax=Durusdinium trenchii TaxID=1381693 RepID=A0ABP0JEJ6_9DINO
MSAGHAADAAAEVAPGARFGPEDDQYEIGKQLGHGAASQVFACRRLRDGEKFAVKTVDLRRLCLLGDMQEQLSRLDCEVRILKELRHERIVNLEGFHKTDNWYFLVMELVRGGELFDVIVRNKSLSEMEARHVFLQLLEGVGFMHSRGVIHRDLKPENLLVASSRPKDGGQLYDVKIADFGLSKTIGGGASLARTRVGTPQYWAPEVLDVQKRGGSYDHAADFWGLGAVLFVMLCGRYPFDGQKQALDEQIRTASYCMSGSRWRGISEAAKSLVRGLLRVNPVDRLSLEECLKHPWVLGQPLPPKTRLEPPVKWELAGEGRHGMAAISENCAEVPKQDTSFPEEADRTERAGSTSCCSVSDSDVGKSCSRVVSSPSSPEDATGTAACSVKGSGFNLAPLLAFFLGRKDFRCGRWRLALVLVLAFAFWGWRSPREKLVAGEGMPLMGRTNVPNALEKPSHFNNLSVEGDEQKLLAAMDVQTPFFYMAGLDPPTDQLLLEASTKDPYQHSLFRLSELLKLQISIVGSLEFANMAVRNVDAELAESTRSAYQQARNLFKQAAEVVARYAEMAQQVSNTVLPDLQLAVDEQEPALAESMLEMLKNWVTDMKKDSNVIRANYGALQNTIGSLADRAQQSKQQADVKLARAVANAQAMLDRENATKKGSCSYAQPEQEQQFQVATRPTEKEITEVSDATEEPSSWVNLEDSVSTWLPSSSSEFNRFNSSDMALVPYHQPTYGEDAKAAAERAASSSRQLLKALNELRRVDSILEGCYVFWANMDGTVQKLGQLKEHAERLVGFASSTPKLKERFGQRMKEYGVFWSDLEQLCSKYSSDHHAASAQMRVVVREVSMATDIRDTENSAYAGVRAAQGSAGAFAGHDAESTSDFPSGTV